MNLSVKLPLLVVPAVVGCMAVAGTLIAADVERTSRDQSLADSRHNAGVYASAVSTYLRSARTSLQAGATDPRILAFARGERNGRAPGVAPPAESAPRGIARGLVGSGVFEFIELVDARGRFRLVEPIAAEPARLRRGVASLAWFQRLRAGGGAPQVSELHISPVTGAPSVVVGVPIRDRGGRLIGAWAGGLRLESFSAVGRVADGSAGYGVLTDARGLVIAHQGDADFVRSQSDFSSVPSVASALAGRSGSGEWRNPIDGETKLGAYMRLPEPGWALVYATPKHVALASSSALGGRIALTVAVAALLALLVTVGIGHALVRPLGRLLGAVDRIADGDLEARAHAGGSGEIARLGARFDEMAGRLSARDASLQARAGELEQRNDEIESFVHAVAHDLRAPLRSINGFSQILLDEHSTSLDETGSGYLRRVGEGAREMGLLIDELLSLSRVGRQEMRPEPVDLSALATEIAEGLRERDPERDVDVTVAPGLTAVADAALVRIALFHLLENAWKFTLATTGATITVGAGEQPGSVTIRDNGAGFDMAYADKLFQPFQRLHDVREFPGTGIGLAITRMAIRRHGGTVRAEGAVGRGATFTVTLEPVAGDPRARRPPATPVLAGAP